MALVLDGRLIRVIAGRIWNFFNNLCREVAKLGGISHCYDWVRYVKYWEEGAWFMLALVGSYCGGCHGRVIGVVVVWRFFSDW